jgi:hypothetical protein
MLILRRPNCINTASGIVTLKSDNTRCCINTIWPPEDEHNLARNMQRTVIYVSYNKGIVHEVGNSNKQPHSVQWTTTNRPMMLKWRKNKTVFCSYKEAYIFLFLFPWASVASHGFTTACWLIVPPTLDVPTFGHQMPLRLPTRSAL